MAVEAISYTQATGKRPWSWRNAAGSLTYEWGFEGDQEVPDAHWIPVEMYDRLPVIPDGGEWVVGYYPAEVDALAAADAAYIKAMADKAIKPIQLEVQP